VIPSEAMESFVLHVPELEEKRGAAKRYDFEIPPAWVEGTLEDANLRPTEDTGSLEVEARMVMRDIVVEASFELGVMAPCARCNEDVKVPLKHRFSMLLQPGAAPSELPEELELTPEDVDRDYYSGEEVALDAAVREQILLELPMRPVHEECPDAELVAYLERDRGAEKKGPLAALAELKVEK